MSSITDINFLSEDDLNLSELSPEELTKAWELWFALAQATNEQDQDLFSHSCFGETMPGKKDQMALCAYLVLVSNAEDAEGGGLLLLSPGILKR